MNLVPARLPLAIHAWVPLALAAFVPLLLVAAIGPLSRRRSRGIATVIALRTVVLLGIGFAALIAVATVAVVQTGLRELRQRHESEVRGLAHEIERIPSANLAVEAPRRFAATRAQDANVAFMATSIDGCTKQCILGALDGALSPTDVRRSLLAGWPGGAGSEYTITIAGRPLLLVAQPIVQHGESRGLVVAGVDAEYLVQQATRTAWSLLVLSYGLLVLVGWSSWKQLNTSLGSRIHAITAQIRNGSVDAPIELLTTQGHELRELADSVSGYILATLEAQKSSDERYRRLVELAPDGVVMCSGSSIKFANPAAIEMSGADSRFDIVGVPIEQFLEFEPGYETSNHTAPRPARWRRIDGRVLNVEVAEIADADGTMQYVVRDVTDRNQREKALTHRAEHDSLTGLVNRARFESRLRELLDPGTSSVRLGLSRQIAVLFIDLDAFKPVNDRYGHAAGDAVLVAVADRLRDATRGSDLIARLGGDEFGVLLEVRDHEEVRAVAARILSSLDRPITFDNDEVRIGASIGIADTHVNGDRPARSAAELIRAADLAMYAAKQGGGGGVAAAA